MTDEERQKLVDDLWLIAGHDRPVSHAICAEAADEIERLAALVQSDAEPVAWRYRWRVNAGVEWTKWREVDEIGAKYYAGLPDHEVQPLYTVPPRSR
jgi:hypothetical protein